MRKKGFTLIEMLVVIAIIGILASIILVNLNSARQKAMIAKATSEIKTLHTAISTMEIEVLKWPGNYSPGQCPDRICGVYNAYCDEGNEICGSGCAYGLFDDRAGLRGNDGSYSKWNGPYLQNEFLDPWGHEYFFDADYENNPGYDQDYAVVIGSYGPDGKTGEGLDYESDSYGEYSEDDIVYVICLP